MLPVPVVGEPESASAATRCNKEREDRGHSPTATPSAAASGEDDEPARPTAPKTKAARKHANRQREGQGVLKQVSATQHEKNKGTNDWATQDAVNTSTRRAAGAGGVDVVQRRRTDWAKEYPALGRAACRTPCPYHLRLPCSPRLTVGPGKNEGLLALGAPGRQAAREPQERLEQ